MGRKAAVVEYLSVSECHGRQIFQIDAATVAASPLRPLGEPVLVLYPLRDSNRKDSPIDIAISPFVESLIPQEAIAFVAGGYRVMRDDFDYGTGRSTYETYHTVPVQFYKDSGRPIRWKEQGELKAGRKAVVGFEYFDSIV